MKLGFCGQICLGNSELNKLNGILYCSTSQNLYCAVEHCKSPRGNRVCIISQTYLAVETRCHGKSLRESLLEGTRFGKQSADCVV